MSPPDRDKGPAFLQTLSTEPGNVWPEGLLHHGARILLLLGIVVVVTALFPPTGRMQEVSRYEEGMVAEEDVIAEVGFTVPKSEAELARERQDARESVPPTFNYRAAAVDSMVARLEGFFARVDTALAGEEGELARQLEQRSIPLTEAQLRLFREPGSYELIRRTALRAAREIVPEGVADASQLRQYRTATITVREGPDRERSVPRDQVLSPREFYDRAVALLPPSAPPDVQQVLRLILIQYLEQSLELNVPATELDRDGAARAVSVSGGEVLQNEVIVRAGDRITGPVLEKLRAYEDQLRGRGELETEGGLSAVPLTGAGLLNLLILAVFGLLLYFFRRDVYTDFRWVLLLAVLILAYNGVGAALAGNELPYELLPVAFVTLAVAVLWDGRLALVLAVVLALLSGVQPPNRSMEVPVIVTTLMGGAAAAFSVRAVRRRAQTWVFGLVIAAAYAVGILALALVGSRETGEVMWAVASAGGNAVLSAILAMGFIPVFELFTGITTDQTLLEWADPNRPLLKRLSMEAPGTYAHTINVANLAEAAANGIGANGLLCRVGLYYHDIGKMLKPHYFVENQPEGRNPHDRLKPDTSAAIVKEHVTEGLELAREEGLPEIVACFIPEHHGTQRIGFFWERAKEEYGEAALDPEDFQYPGPRPRSRETAIAMLADSVESATRALQDPTPERVRDLIHSIVDAKIADGQLDDAPVTLREVARIKEQFVKVLSGIYHHRIDYPQTRHLTDAPEEEDEGDASAEGAGDEARGASAGDEGGEAGPGSVEKSDEDASEREGEEDEEPSGRETGSDEGSIPSGAASERGDGGGSGSREPRS